MPDLRPDSDWEDESGPTEAALSRIRTWPTRTVHDMRQLIRFVRSLWRYGWWTEGPGTDARGRREWQVEISTGGWSGNEATIEALQQNEMFWFVCWVSSTRGGHYVFALPPDFDTQTETT